jgi:hypothetical protein
VDYIVVNKEQIASIAHKVEAAEERHRTDVADREAAFESRMADVRQQFSIQVSIL